RRRIPRVARTFRAICWILRSAQDDTPPLRMTLVVENLTVHVGGVEAVHNLSFALEAGQRTGLIGESGSGKTLTALAIMGLLPEGLGATGKAVYRDRDLLA